MDKARRQQSAGTMHRREKNVRIKVNSSVGKLAELSSLLELSGLLGVLEFVTSVSWFARLEEIR